MCIFNLLHHFIHHLIQTPSRPNCSITPVLVHDHHFIHHLSSSMIAYYFSIVTSIIAPSSIMIIISLVCASSALDEHRSIHHDLSPTNLSYIKHHLPFYIIHHQCSIIYHFCISSCYDKSCIMINETTDDWRSGGEPIAIITSKGTIIIIINISTAIIIIQRL